MSNQVATIDNNTPAIINDTASIMAVIERVAMNPDVDVDKMQKLLDMQERVLNRKAQSAFAAALANLQANLPEIEQNGAIKHGDKIISKYAKFEDINEAVKPILNAHGFAVSFRVKQSDGKIEVTAILSHREGHSEETSIVLPADTSGAKNAVQAQGSSVSYGKRYAMCALLNISTRGEDDDANSIFRIDTEQAANLDNLIKETKANKQSFLEYFKVSDVRHISTKDYENALKLLNKKKEKKGGAA